MLRKIISLFCLFNMVFWTFASDAYTWGPVTHYHINDQARSGFEYQEIYAFNGTGPDMFNLLKNFPDYAHSPNPKKEGAERPYWDSPNSAYLMLKVAGLDTSISSKNEAYGLGWGGHIAADWVAHNDNLFPISPRGSKEEKLHFLGETLYDLYVYNTRGPISPYAYEFPFKWKLKFSPSLVYKAMINYLMIDIYETPEGRELSDEKLKEDALKASLSKDDIKERAGKWAVKIGVIEAAYVVTLGKMGPVGREAFREAMRAKGAEENLALSAQSVSDWIEAKSPRNKIPNFDDRVIPFWPFPLSSSQNSFSFLQPQLAWAESNPVGLKNSSEEPDAHEAASIFWEDVATQAEQFGILQTQEQTITDEEGEEELEVTVTLTDPEKFEQIFRNTIQNHIQNPASETGKRYAYFWKNLFIDGISDPVQLMDMTPAAISNPVPEDNSYTPWHKPLISATVEDDSLGIGIDEESIRMKVDGVEVNPAYIPVLGSVIYTPPDYLTTGKHTVSLEVSDKAGNKTSQTWNFTIKTLFNKALFSDGELSIKGNSQIKGDVYSNEEAAISGNSKIEGNISAVESIEVKGNAQVLGEIRENQLPMPLPQIDFAYYEYLAKNQGTFIQGEAHFNEKNLPPGLIFVDGEVEISGNFSAEATIFATSEIEVSGRVDLSSALDSLVLVTKDEIELSGTGVIKGVIYSQASEIKISGSKSYFGAIFAGQELEISGNSRIEHDPSLGK